MGVSQKQQAAKKTASKLPSHANRQRRKKRGETFALYIYKVLKQVQPKIGVSKKSMCIMNSLINDVFDRLSTEANRLILINQKRTLSCREVQTAVRLLFPGELAKHAVTEGVKATEKFQAR